MLNPGVGRGTLNPTAPMIVVVFGVELVLAAPNCRFTAAGSKLPPMRRNTTFPPTEVRLCVAPGCFQLATPAVNVSVERPSDARPPHVFPFPQSAFGCA